MFTYVTEHNEVSPYKISIAVFPPTRAPKKTQNHTMSKTMP